MSHEIDMSNGRENMAYAGAVPWHRLGNKLERDATIETWQEAAGLNWSAIASPVQYETIEGDRRTYEGRNVLLRSDTGAPLSVVSEGYHPVQPGTILEFYRDLVENYGAFTIESAGSLQGGRKIWALAKATEEMFELCSQTRDTVARYLLLATSFDKSMATIVQQTSVYVVCMNTLGAAYGRGEEGAETQIKINHSTAFDPAQVKDEIYLNEQWQGFTSAIHQLATRKVSNLEAINYFSEVYYPGREFDDLSKREETNIDNMLTTRAHMPGAELSSVNGTAWGLVNAVTFREDHGGRARSDDRRMTSAWFGAGERHKHKAWDAALALAN